jgi:hypothetical protein
MSLSIRFMPSHINSIFTVNTPILHLSIFPQHIILFPPHIILCYSQFGILILICCTKFEFCCAKPLKL